MNKRQPIPEARRMAGKVFFGVCLAAAGLLLLLNNIGQLPVNLDWRLWPLFLAALAGARMVERGLLRTGPHVLVMVSLFLLAATYEREDLIERWWPIAVVWIGALIALRAVAGRIQPAEPPCPPPQPYDAQDERPS